MGDAVVVKSGKLQLQVKSFMRTNWVEKFCVLYGRSASSHPYMDFYDSKDAFESYKKSGKKCDKTINLQHLKVVKHSSQKTSHGQENLIEIHCGRNSKNFLTVKREEEMRDWSSKLDSFVSVTEGEGSSAGQRNDPEPDYSDDDEDENCDLSTVNMMYESSDNATRFEVEVLHGELASLCGIEGKKTLLVSESELAFEDPLAKRILYTFSFQWMRRYGKSSKDKFHFEVGRKCPNGPGSVFLITSQGKDIHALMSRKTNNKSTTKTPSAPAWMSDLENKKSDSPPPPPEQKPVDRSGIGGPAFVSNTGRRHPGAKNVPVLVPIPAPLNPEQNGHSPTTPPPGDTHLKDRDSASGKFRKELEGKLHDDGSRKTSLKEGSKKSKEEKKKEKELEKERERKEKEAEKEREREKKEMEKEKERKEKELEKERKAKDKDKKSKLGGFFSSGSKKDKDKEKDVEKEEKAGPFTSSNRYRGDNLYEEPDLHPVPAKPAPSIGEALYDVADVPVEPKHKSYHSEPDETVYDEAISISRSSAPPTSSDPVEYATPNITKPSPQGTVYSDVRNVEKESQAWRQFGRKENEEEHMEDYSSIKDARGMIQNMPPVPTRNYDDDEEDDTYDRTTNVTGYNRSAQNAENLYGTASGPVGDVVSVPQANKASDSEGEDLYDNPEVEEYETTGNQPGRPLVQAYEETNLQPKPNQWKPKPAPTPKQYPGNDALYEDIL